MTVVLIAMYSHKGYVLGLIRLLGYGEFYSDISCHVMWFVMSIATVVEITMVYRQALMFMWNTAACNTNRGNKSFRILALKFGI